MVVEAHKRPFASRALLSTQGCGGGSTQSDKSGGLIKFVNCKMHLKASTAAPKRERGKGRKREDESTAAGPKDKVLLRVVAKEALWLWLPRCVVWHNKMRASNENELGIKQATRHGARQSAKWQQNYQAEKRASL